MSGELPGDAISAAAIKAFVAARPLMAAAIAAQEREACAQLAEQYDAICWTDDEDDRPFADLIRARGAHTPGGAT